MTTLSQGLTLNALVSVSVAGTLVTDESVTAVTAFIDLITPRTTLHVQHRYTLTYTINQSDNGLHNIQTYNNNNIN